MSTWASIGIMNDKGKIKSIALMHDGYPEHAGVILNKHYTDEKKVNTLINLGWLYLLGEGLEAPKAVKDYGINWYYSDEFEMLDETEQKKYKDDYSSDKGSVSMLRDGKNREEDYTPKVSDGLEEWLKNRGYSYSYVFYKGKWYAYDSRGVSISTTTGKAVRPHNILGSNKLNNKRRTKVKYTREMADTDMRMIKKYMKGQPYGSMSVEFTITKDVVVKEFNTIDPVPDFKVRRGTDYVRLEVGYRDLYDWDYKVSSKKPVKEKTMGELKDILYRTINECIRYVESKAL